MRQLSNNGHSFSPHHGRPPFTVLLPRWGKLNHVLSPNMCGLILLVLMVPLQMLICLYFTIVINLSIHLSWRCYHLSLSIFASAWYLILLIWAYFHSNALQKGNEHSALAYDAILKVPIPMWMALEKSYFCCLFQHSAKISHSWQDSH